MTYNADHAKLTSPHNTLHFQIVILNLGFGNLAFLQVVAPHHALLQQGLQGSSQNCLCNFLWQCHDLRHIVDMINLLQVTAVVVLHTGANWLFQNLLLQARWLHPWVAVLACIASVQPDVLHSDLAAQCVTTRQHLSFCYSCLACIRRSQRLTCIWSAVLLQDFVAGGLLALPWGFSIRVGTFITQ